ncbi:MAG: hypothetical protein M1839_001131 [Geoglossum umbratile]|nr:MAG: hypothetical protein M1839_001131 [Geoglossum umbratile]
MLLRPPCLRINPPTAYSSVTRRYLRGPRGTVSRPAQPSRIPTPSIGPRISTEQGRNVNAVSEALHLAKNQDNSLLCPVHIPEDPNGVLRETHPAAGILANSAIVIQRQLELMNVMIGFEQANKYVIMDPQGNHIGYMAERETGIANTLARQWLRTHRSFTAHVFDRQEREVLRFHRPFAWISSRIRVYDPIAPAPPVHSQARTLEVATSPPSPQVSPLSLTDMRVIGEAQQQWAPLRRKYNLFLFQHPPTAETDLGSHPFSSTDLPLSDSQRLQFQPDGGSGTGGEYAQFAYVDEPFLSWDFSLLTAESKLIGSVNRNFAGFAREIFTDTGVYALRMDAAGLADEPKHLISKTGTTHAVAHGRSGPGMTLDQRAVMLATAVSIDFDYFSRKSASGGMGFLPLWFPGGGEAAAGGAAAEGAVAEGAAGAGAVGGAARGAAGTGPGEGALVGGAALGGYEGLQRGMYGGDSPQTVAQGPPSLGNLESNPTQTPPEFTDDIEDVWSDDPNPWGSDQEGDQRGGNGGEVDEEDGDWGDLF